MVNIYKKINLKDLFKIGAHIGHQTRYRHVLMTSNIIGQRSKIDICNLEKTIMMLYSLSKIIRFLVKTKSRFSIINTLPMFNSLLYFLTDYLTKKNITGAWANGTLTNLVSSKKILKQKQNLFLQKMPEFVFLLNLKKNINILKELSVLNIPNFVLADTNVNISQVTYPIPSNDDSFIVVYFFLIYISLCFKYFLISWLPQKRKKFIVQRYFKNYGLKYKYKIKIQFKKTC